VSEERLATDPELFPLRPGRGTIALHATGFRHPAGFGAERFVAYSDVTHLATGIRAIRIGTQHGLVAIPRSFFRDPTDGDRLVRALLERIAREPGGSLQLARMAEIEESLRQPFTPWVTHAVAVACVAIYVLGLVVGPTLEHAGFFSSTLSTHGEPWRLVTGNLLHAGWLHLVLNMMGLVLIGSLVERMIGSARTVLVMGFAALGTTLAGLVMHYEYMIGASGIVTGLFGALLWLELRLPDRLPAMWRIPRRLLWLALGCQLVLDLMLPFVASAAHIGGFLAGGLAAALSVGPGLRRDRLAPALAVATSLVVMVAGASVLSAARLAAGGRALELHAARLLELEDIAPMILNDVAWFIATSPKPSDAALASATQLAERAVRETERANPDLLDTLAEVEFQRGRASDALDTIDEAIALAPDVDYFREQRRRFRGERAADDRPAPPAAPYIERGPAAPGEPMLPPPDDEHPGVEI